MLEVQNLKKKKITVYVCVILKCASLKYINIYIKFHREMYHFLTYNYNNENLNSTNFQVHSRRVAFACAIKVKN